MILSESVCRNQNSGPCDVNQQLSRRRKELASFMGSLLEEMAKAEAAKVGISSESTSVLGNKNFYTFYCGLYYKHVTIIMIN
jgi:hypothetical protein